jgi:hypothetical protein
LGRGKPQIKIKGIIFSRLIFFKVTRVRRAWQTPCAMQVLSCSRHESDCSAMKI